VAHTNLDVPWALRWMELAHATMREQRSHLMALDRAIGDGDHGDNLDRGFTAAAAALAQTDPGDIGAVLKTVAMTLMSTVGGAAGPLYGTAFLRAATATTTPDIDGPALVAALDAAATGIAARGKATVGEKTMLDAWIPAVTAARTALADGAEPGAILEAAAAAAEQGARDTEPMVATKGRASYLGERSAGHRDPGAESSAMLLRCAAEAAESRATANEAT